MVRIREVVTESSNNKIENRVSKVGVCLEEPNNLRRKQRSNSVESVSKGDPTPSTLPADQQKAYI